MDYLETLKKLLRSSDHVTLVKEEQYWHTVWNQYISECSDYYEGLSNYDAITRLISEQNYTQRSQHTGCKSLGVRIRVGDICFIDFGKAYLNEAGFQHFGFILTIKNHKALVIPMTSHRNKKSELEKNHLFYIGKIEGMAKDSTLFLNDARFINTARIIDVKAHIPKNSGLFKDISQRFCETVK